MYDNIPLKFTVKMILLVSHKVIVPLNSNRAPLCAPRQ